MSAEQNKAFIRRYLEALSGKGKPRELVEQYVDAPELREHIAETEAAFPSYILQEEDVIAEGAEVAVRFTFRGTHRGEFLGVPPTGRDVSFDGIIIYRIAGEKIVDHWMQVDSPTLMRQLS